MRTRGVMGAIVLDAASDVALAREKLEEHPADRYLAIRRQRGRVVFWYALRVGELLGLFSNVADDRMVGDALDLHERDSSPVVRSADSVEHQLDAGPMVVFDEGSGRVGVIESDTTGKDLDLASIETDGDGGTGGDTGSWEPFRRNRRVRRGVGAAVPGPERPFTAFPKVRGPNTVSPGKLFRLKVGLGTAPDAQSGDVSFDIQLPPDVTEFNLGVRIVAEGFRAPQGWSHTLNVACAKPERNVLDVELIAPDVREPSLVVISVIFTYAGLPRGMATWKIAVVPEGADVYDDACGHGVLWSEDEAAPPAAVQVAAETPPIDLTVCISKPDGNPVSGRYQWSFFTPHPVAMPEESPVTDLGADAADFSRKVIEAVRENDGSDLLEFEMPGLGNKVARAAPPELWEAVRKIYDHVRGQSPDRVPTLLIATSESHVPWELAHVDPPFDPARPPYLGAQLCVARWILSPAGPALPPPTVVQVKHMAVVVGDYAARSGYRQLEHAKKEGEHLRDEYGAVLLQAEPTDIVKLLGARVPVNGEESGVEAVHFACHGEVDPAHTLDAAIILQEGQRLRPEVLEACPLSKQYKPFLFLNACQVGAATEILGEFAGFSGSALAGGCSGFVGPLWSVNDERAHRLAVDFYRDTLGDGTSDRISVAWALYELRSRFAKERNAATWLSYVFYGHPDLTLEWEA